MKCRVCEGNFYDEKTHTCKDNETFVDKFNFREIRCRYSENAIPFSEAYDMTNVNLKDIKNDK